MTASPRIAITGIGCITSLGFSADETFAALIQGRRGLGRLTLFPSGRYGHMPVAEINRPLPELPARIRRSSRTEQLAYAASAEALAQAGFGPAVPDAQAWACLAGTTVAGMFSTEDYFNKAWSGRPAVPSQLSHHLAGSVSQTLARQFGMQGLVTTLSTACASGVHAVVLGATLIRQGAARRVLACGADSLSRMTLNGFGSLLIMDPAGGRPFDEDRRGLSLGEAAGALVLEREEDAIGRGARILAFVAGGGNTCDAYHPSAPDPEGRGAEAAMRQALAEAGIRPDQVGYVNAHGTGTPDNDRAESLALSRVFKDSKPMISSTKGAIGHTLGAAGAVESVICVQALLTRTLPGTIGCSKPDPELPVRPLLESLQHVVCFTMNNAFGFGGNNGCAIFASGEARPC